MRRKLSVIKEPDLEKYTQEMQAMQALPPASVELPLVAALAIISHIQVAVRHPEMKGSKFAELAIDTAKQLQGLFDSESETYNILELGWNPEADLPANPEAPEGFCEEPCDKFLQNLGCRCTGYQVAEVVGGADDIDPKTLVAGAAMMHHIKQSLQSEGFELDM
jgi:hypothetical protein